MGNKNTIEDMRQIAHNRGLERAGVPGECLSDEYINGRTPLTWKCNGCNRIWDVRPLNIISGTWCGQCGRKKGRSVDDMKNMAKERGIEKTGVPGEFLSDDFKGQNVKHKWKCGKCGNIWDAVPSSIERGSWCRNCFLKNRKPRDNITIKDMQKLAHERGLEKTGVPGKCSSTEYINNKTKLDWQCGKCNHKWSATSNRIQAGTWCPECGKKDRARNHSLNIEDMKVLAFERGLERTAKPGKCLSQDYKGQKYPLKWQYGKCGRKWKSKPTIIQQGGWCRQCGESATLTLEDMHKLAYTRGLKRTGKPGKCLSTEYKGAKGYLEWKCGECGHIWGARPTNIQQGSWCDQCSQYYGERVCRGFFEHIFNHRFPTISPKWLINPKTGRRMHLDGYNPKLKLAFEYNGQQHYEFCPFFHKTKKDFERQQERDRIKRKLCEKHGILLITIPYWVDFDEMQNVIISKYHKITNKKLPKMDIFDYKSLFE